MAAQSFLLPTFIVLAFAPITLPAADAAPKKVTLQGVLMVVRDEEAKKVESISFSTADGEYTVKLDEQGLALEAMDGKTVEIVGCVEEKDDSRILTVETCREVPDEPKKTE